MNKLWMGMLLIGIVYGACTGKMPEITQAALDAAKDAISLCITMAGVMAFWVGMMRIAEKSGLIQSISRKIQPMIHFLFPRIPKGHKATHYIAENMISNVFGLGWAATPAGLKAMEAMQELRIERVLENEMLDKVRSRKQLGIRDQTEDGHRIADMETASDEMCTFLVINISSLQLIPVNIIAYRSQYGSVNPAAIVGPGILATGISTAAAVLFCKCMTGRKSSR